MGTQEPVRKTGGRALPAVAGVLLSLALLAATVLLGDFYLKLFPPVRWVPPAAAEGTVDGTAMAEALRPERVAARQDRILALGSRFMGQNGMEEAGRMMRRAFEAAGLEILEHRVQTVAPQTELRELWVERGGKAVASGVEIYPFMPNHLQPSVTPDEGLAGRLVVLDRAALQSRRDFTGVIGLIDAKEGAYDPDFAFDWVRYARLGVKALIVSHSGGFDQVPWNRVAGERAGMVASIPVNYVRVAAPPEIFRLAGQEIRLKVRTRLAPVPNTTYYGILRAARPAREALVLLAPYDAMSVLPDAAPGGMQAVTPALMLQLLDGFTAYRTTLDRDVVFVAYGSSVMAEDAVNHLARILQKNTKLSEENNLMKALGLSARPVEKRRIQHLTRREAENRTEAAPLPVLAALWNEPGFLQDPEATERALDRLEEPPRRVFDTQFAYVLNTLVLELADPLLERRLAFLRKKELTGTAGLGTPEFAAYLEAKRRYDLAVNYAGFSAPNLLRRAPRLAVDHQLRERVLRRIDELRAFHEATALRLEQEKALARAFDRYDHFTAFALRLAPSAAEKPEPESLSLHTLRPQETPQVAELLNVFDAAAQSQPGAAPVQRNTRATGDLSLQVAPAPVESAPILDRWGYAAYTVFNTGRQTAFDHYASPVVTPLMRRLESLRGSLQTVGAAFLALAHGQGAMAPSVAQEWIYFSFGGQVMVSNVGQSIVPNYPLAGAIIANRSPEGEPLHGRPGHYVHPFLMADPYGRYRAEFNSNDFPVWTRVYGSGLDYSPLAAGYGRDGLIRFIKDEGEDGQRLFKSAKLNIRSGGRENTTIVTFRAAPVSVMDLTNPQTMKDFTSTRFVGAEGLVEPRKMLHIRGTGLNVTFLEPDKRVHLLFQSGAPGNELVQATRAFMLGVDDPLADLRGRDIQGPGYLAADHSILLAPAMETARSMASVNGRRLHLQERHSMVDAQMRAYQDKTLGHLRSAEAPGLSFMEVVREARTAVTYAILNHPVLRRNVVEAVVSILWYLALLVPFVFFFEKLVFGFADVRKQLAAQAVVFLLAFALLRILHPAFEMVRSSVMILLGFIIILISGSITVVFSGKFQDNLEELRRRQGKVAGAGVNTLGVLGSAFMLGLNNMHRRKVRTGLTCATLMLLTFVMISFTSVRNDLAVEDTAVGRAPYQGLLVKNEMFQRLSNAEVLSFKAKYGAMFDVAERRHYRGTVDWRDRQRYNPQFGIQREDTGGELRLAEFDTILQLAPREPLRQGLAMLTRPRWFTEEDLRNSTVCPVILPEPLAAALAITPAMVDAGDVPVTILGRAFRVIGIFRAGALDELRDLDGQDLLPYDIETVSEVIDSPAGHLAKDDAPRIPGDRTVITPVRDLFNTVPRGVLVHSSLAISMPGVPFREASHAIVEFMEQTARPVFYGLDGVATKGKRRREVSLEGLVDLVIPLIIAGLTVLNTMKGSVYERRDEIYVYNAVGIAPRYVFFMFIAEAMVYAVVGSVLGYFLSQGTGRILTELGWTGGLNMTYASLSTIYASLTIMAAVFVSTWFPARSAMEIAKPADDAGWKLPEPDGDEWAFDLPFNFRSKGRMAVLAFFNRYLLDHAEGSSGRFFASAPRMAASAAGDGAVPLLETTIWLKPFDLAVSQKLCIAIPVDPETGQFKARITLTRLSGTREAWMRLNRGFITLLRRHFLHWRAVTPDQRAEMFEEAREKFQRDVVEATV